MNICIFGQGTGGNAALWFDALNSSEMKKKIIFVSRTVATLAARFRIYAPYGKGHIPSFIYRFYAPLVARYVIPTLFYYLKFFKKVDVLILQGNYTPKVCLKIANILKCPTILNIYGSDYYRKYLLGEFNDENKKSFENLLTSVSLIVFNWQSALDDFCNQFPELRQKCLVNPWGVNPAWLSQTEDGLGLEQEKFCFLSTRALYDYNNVDKVVEAFCLAFKGDPKFQLKIISGYGSQPNEIEKVRKIMNKYNVTNTIDLDVGRWISDDDLMKSYATSHCNICFGSSDQLTLSITYAFIMRCRNILSPLPSYFMLENYGFESHIICDSFSLDNLVQAMRLAASERDLISLEKDKITAKSIFNMQRTLKAYHDLCEQLIKRLN